MHGWLNTGRQKSKISPDAVDSHKRPRCHEPEETQEHILIWSCSPTYEEGTTEQPMPCPRNLHQVYQVLARISGNSYTGCEQCTWVTTWIDSTGNWWPATHWMAYDNERLPQ
jgi:hypothetical protein